MKATTKVNEPLFIAGATYWKSDFHRLE